MIFVTGGAGFIGANFAHYWLGCSDEPLLVLDSLTYAGNLESLTDLRADTRLGFECVDICDRTSVAALLERHQPRALVHFAAESHVDRSIDAPEAFVRANIQGTYQLLEAVRACHASLDEPDSTAFRFLHVSTDEVFGSLGPEDAAFFENTPHAPNSPYSASKAASDHLVRAWHHTYRLPVLTTNCSNNYGPYQFPEKLIPLMIHNALAGKPLPVYGDGQNVRDWLYVEDHCRAIARVLEAGRPGETYNIGGHNEVRNIDVVHAVCDLLDEMRPRADGSSYRALVSFVRDRPGHDRRYAIDAGKIQRELGWKPQETFASGLRRTVAWYLDHAEWVEHVTSGAYREWVDTQYGRLSSERLA